MKKKRILNVFIIAFVFLVFVFASRKLLPLGMLAFNDALPFSERAQDALRMFLSAWDNRSPGLNLPLRHGPFLFLIEWILIKLCFGNAALAQKIFLILPMPLAFLSMFLFLERFVKSYFARFVASSIYSINPMTIGEFHGGWVQNIYVQALLPLILIFLYKIRKGYKVKDITICAIFLSLAYLLSDHVIIYLIPFFLFWLCSDIARLYRQQSLREIAKRMRAVLILGLICFFITLPQTIFFLKSALPFVKAGGSSLRSDVIQQLTSDVSYCYGQSNLLTILKIGGSSVYLPLIVFLPSLLVVFSLFSVLDKDKRYYIIAFLLGALAIIAFIWLTYKKYTLGLFKEFPFLFRFRNHSRPLLFLTFMYAPLIAIGVEWVLIQVRKPSSLKGSIAAIGVGILLLGSVLVYDQIIFPGDLGLIKAHGEGMVIPKTFYEINHWLESKRQAEGDFRTLWLPWEFNEEEVKLAWLDKFTLSLPIGYGQYALTPLAEYISFIFRSICYEATDRLGALLVPANVKYIIVYLGSSQRGILKTASAFLTPYIFGDPLNFRNFLDRQKDLKLIVKREKYLIYENTIFLSQNNIMRYEKEILVSNSFKSDPFLVFLQLVNKSLINPSEDLLIFKEQLASTRDFLNAKPLLQEFYLEPLLFEDFTESKLDETKWVAVEEPRYSIKNSEIVFPLKQGKSERLLSKQEFSYPMTFEIRFKIIRNDLAGELRIETDGNNSIGVLYSADGKTRFETHDSSKNTTTNIKELDPGEYHIYKIIWEKDSVQLFIDNQLVAVHTSSIPNGWLKILFTGTSGQVFMIDFVKAQKGSVAEPIKIYRFENKNQNILFKSFKVDNAEYKLDLQQPLNPMFITLSEAYDQDWDAYSSSKKSVHFPAFYCFNGFYAKEAKDTVSLLYRPKIVKHYTIAISAVAWLLAFGIILL